MKQIKTTEVGGFPLRMNDIAFLQESYNEIFSSIIKAYSVQVFILQMEIMLINFIYLIIVKDLLVG